MTTPIKAVVVTLALVASGPAWADELSPSFIHDLGTANMTCTDKAPCTPVPLSEIFDAMAAAVEQPFTIGTNTFHDDPRRQKEAAMYRAIAEVYRRHGQ